LALFFIRIFAFARIARGFGVWFIREDALLVAFENGRQRKEARPDQAIMDGLVTLRFA
jgi:hypothetical protein